MVSATHQRVLLVSFLMACLCHAQSTNGTGSQNSVELNVNWLYGAYLPKNIPRNTLSGEQRRKLYARQTFTTPGIYLKTMLFAAGDHINNSPPGWGEGGDGYFRRAASRHVQFVLQNSFVAWGNWKLGYEPRYDRCKCSGFWKRTGHAAARNFVTYDRSQRWLRPQIALFAGAFTAGVIAGTWKPKDHNLATEGYRAMFTQAAFGVGANWLGEFMPDIARVLRGKRGSD